MDPRHGELSPAMRNRGVEIFLEKPPCFNLQEKDSTDIIMNTEDGNLPVEDMTCYTHAFIVTRQLELLKNMTKVRIELVRTPSWSLSSILFPLSYMSVGLFYILGQYSYCRYGTYQGFSELPYTGISN